VRTRSIFTLAALVGAACSTDQKTSDTAASAPPDSPSARIPPRSADTPGATATDTSHGWTATFGGVGPVRVGMSADDLRRVAGDFPPPKDGTQCAYVHPASAPAGVVVMLARGQVARVDVDSAGTRTEAGVGVGDSTARVNDAYAGRVAATPHKYVQGGQYLTARAASPADASLRIVFETDSGHVTRYRTGRTPEVDWVERCG